MVEQICLWILWLIAVTKEQFEEMEQPKPVELLGGTLQGGTETCAHLTVYRQLTVTKAAAASHRMR